MRGTKEEMVKRERKGLIRLSESGQAMGKLERKVRKEQKEVKRINSETSRKNGENSTKSVALESKTHGMVINKNDSMF